MSAKLRVLVSPGGKRNEIAGTVDGELRVRVAAPPVDGKANRELITFLAKRLNLPPSALTLIRGVTSRHKVIEITGLDPQEALGRLLG